MDNDENLIIQPPPPGRKVQELTNRERERLIARLLLQFSNGVLSHSSIKLMVVEFHVHHDTISSIWNRFRKATENNVNDDVNIVNNIHSQKASWGRSVKYDTVALAEALAKQLIEYRQTVRSAATLLSVSTTTVFKPFKLSWNQLFYAMVETSLRYSILEKNN